MVLLPPHSYSESPFSESSLLRVSTWAVYSASPLGLSLRSPLLLQQSQSSDNAAAGAAAMLKTTYVAKQLPLQIGFQRHLLLNNMFYPSLDITSNEYSRIRDGDTKNTTTCHILSSKAVNSIMIKYVQTPIINYCLLLSLSASHLGFA